MKISNSIPALLFLTGMMCLFFNSCNDDESEIGTMVPLRLSMTIPAAEGSVTTRAAETGKFNIALSTSSGYANNAKEYTTTSSSTSSAALTSTDPLKISRLVNTTPLTLYGTYNYSNLGNQPVFYSGNANVAEGSVSIQPKWGNAIIVVKADNGERYKVNIKSLYSPTISNNQYTWNTNGSIPTLVSSGANPTEFETTSAITKPDNLASGYYASVVPGRVGNDINIMSITEWDGNKRGDTYEVKTPSDITFEANKCYFITLNVNEGEIVTMNISITGMTSTIIDLGTKPGIYNQQDLKDFRDAWNNNNGSEGIASGVYAKWLNEKSNTVNMYADIDLENEEWVSIKTWKNVTFDGNNHTLSNLLQSDSNKDIGFFSEINSRVENLTIQEANLNLPNKPVGVFSVFNNGIISNCHINNATIQSSLGGGFVCNITGGRIEDCSISNSSITGATATATGKAAGIAAIASNYPETVEITGCTVSGCSIDGEAENSGIVGLQVFGLGATITACTVSDVQLVKTKKYHAIADGASNIIKDCSYTNVWAGGVLITTE